jgi:predicted nuclease with TOPRIM domain
MESAGEQGFMTSKEDFSTTVRAELDELRGEIGRVQNRAEEADGEARERLQNQIGMLLTKFERVRQRIEELEDAEGNSWKDVKGKVDGALSDLNRSIRNVLAPLA